MQEEFKKIPNYMKFILGGLAGMTGVFVIQPIDLVKIRMQTQCTGQLREYKNSLHCFRSIIRKEGLTAIYSGLGAGLLRQATYTTARLGVYSYLIDLYKTRRRTDPTFLSRMGMGSIAGAIGAFVGTPSEVVLIRMAADGRLPIDKRRNYNNVFNALARVVREEKIYALWRGCIPTVGRAIVVNMIQLSTYSHVKKYLVNSFEMEAGLKVNLYASMTSGFVTTIASMPVDLAKTSIQNMKYIDGVGEYKGTSDVIFKIIRIDGVMALWKGFAPYYCRVGPHTILTFILLEQYTKLYSKYFLGIGNKGSNF